MPEQILFDPVGTTGFDGGHVAGLARVGSPAPGEAAVGLAMHNRRASFTEPRGQGARIGRSPVGGIWPHGRSTCALFPLPTLVAPVATPGGSPWFDFLAAQASGHAPGSSRPGSWPRHVSYRFRNHAPIVCTSPGAVGGTVSEPLVGGVPRRYRPNSWPADLLRSLERWKLRAIHRPRVLARLLIRLIRPCAISKQWPPLLFGAVILVRFCGEIPNQISL